VQIFSETSWGTFVFLAFPRSWVCALHARDAIALVKSLHLVSSICLPRGEQLRLILRLLDRSSRAVFELIRTPVGDRGMLSQTQIDVLMQRLGLGWISALRSGAIRRLLADGHLVKKDLEVEILDGIYVIRTSEPAERLTAADGVRS
jgi:hypothetical protein